MKLLGAFSHRFLLFGGIALVLTNRLLMRIRLRRRADGWRRGAGLVLREESATFVLSAFGLDVWSDVRTPPANMSVEASAEHLAERLERFLAAERDVHVCIRHTAIVDHAETSGRPTYTLGFQPWVDEPGRFVRPDSWTGIDRLNRHPEGGGADRGGKSSAGVLLNFIARVHADGQADLWVRVNHVGIDGVPMQDVLSRLETAWGVRGPVVFPHPEENAGHRGPRPCPGRGGIAEVQDFIDFGPLLAWRKRENARLPEPMTISAAILWALARHDFFSSTRTGTTVELPAMDGLGRGVGVVVVRPADYFRRENGLADYVRDFNRELNLVRRRQSEGCKTLDAAALIPAGLEARLLRHALESGRAFGTMGLSMIREAKVFGAPMGDVGHADGFIAIGNVTLDASDGRKVGCVAIKGPAERIANYPAIMREAFERL